MTKDPLTVKQRKFVEEYYKTGCASDAVAAAYEVTSDMSKHKMAQNLKNNPKVALAIREKFLDQYPALASDTANLANNLMSKLLEKVENMPPEEVTMDQVLKFMELMSKIGGLIAPQKNTSLNIKAKAPEDALNKFLNMGD